MTQADLDGEALRAYAELMRSIAQKTGQEQSWLDWVQAAKARDAQWAWHYQLLMAEHLVMQGDHQGGIELFTRVVEQLKPGANLMQVLIRKLTVFKDAGSDGDVLSEGMIAYYETVFALEDGFAGVSEREGISQLKTVVADDAQRLVDRHLLEQYQQRCGEKRPPLRGKCLEHFSALLEELR